MTNGNRTVTKRDVVERISERTGLKKTDVKLVLQEFLEEIITELGAGNRLEFRDFGVFETRTRAARTAQNPKTLEPVPVPEKSTVKFKPGRRMKQALEIDQIKEIKPGMEKPDLDRGQSGDDGQSPNGTAE